MNIRQLSRRGMLHRMLGGAHAVYEYLCVQKLKIKGLCTHGAVFRSPFKGITHSEQRCNNELAAYLQRMQPNCVFPRRKGIPLRRLSQYQRCIFTPKNKHFPCMIPTTSPGLPCQQVARLSVMETARFSSPLPLHFQLRNNSYSRKCTRTVSMALHFQVSQDK